MADTAADLRHSSAGQDCTYSLLAKAFHERFTHRDSFGSYVFKRSFEHMPLDGKLASSQILYVMGDRVNEMTASSPREWIDVLNA